MMEDPADVAWTSPRAKSSAPGRPSREPPRSIQERLLAIIKTFEESVGTVRGSAVADREGLPIISGFREPFDLTAVTAMSALAMQSARKVFDSIRLGKIRGVAFDGEDAKVIVVPLGGGRASFITVVHPNTNVGLLKLEMRAAAQRIEEELGYTNGSEPRIEEVFLLTKGGLLISHISRTFVHTKDRDLLGAMFTAVQSFVRDAFHNKGGGLNEMELAHLRVRFLQGRETILAVIGTGPFDNAYLTRAGIALEEFEERHLEALRPWNGSADSLSGLDTLFEDLLPPSRG